MQRFFSAVTELHVFVNVGEKGYSKANKLQEVVVKIISTEVCNRRDWYNNDVDESMVCAGYKKGGRDSCAGDSGGPLVCRRADGGRYKLIGVVSWGEGCAEAKKPGVYAKTAAVLGWINSYVKGVHMHFSVIKLIVNHYCY